MKHIQFFILLEIFFAIPTFATNWTAPRENAPTFKVGITGASLDTTIKDPKDNSKTQIQYTPNSLGRLTVGIEYLGFGASAGFASDYKQEDIRLKGKTSGQDYQFRFFKEQNTFDFFYQKYAGYYIKNSTQIDPTLHSSDPFIQRPDLHTEHYGFQYFYTLEPSELSLGASFNQSGWQKQTGATWFGYSALDKYHIDSDYSLIPTQMISLYQNIQDFSQGDFLTFKIGAGGAFNLVYNNFYLAGMFILAGGQQQQKYRLGSEFIQRIIPTGGGNFKISAGYNGDSYFTALNLFADSTDLTIADKTLSMGTIETNLMFGTHF